MTVDDQWEDWIWICPKCGNRGTGVGEADAVQRRNTHLWMVHKVKPEESS